MEIEVKKNYVVEANLAYLVHTHICLAMLGEETVFEMLKFTSDSLY